MKTLLVLVFAVAFAPVTLAGVWTAVYRCDETTPLAAVDPNYPTVYRDIMVGTKLTLVISSDAGTDWWGALALSWDDWNYGTVTARGYNEETASFDGSCLPAAGRQPLAVDIPDANTIGFQFGAGLGAAAGRWFIVDYHAERVGSCNVGFYDGDYSWDVPRDILSFHHVPSRDFDGDGVVNFEDFALLASRWRSSGDLDPNEATFDLNTDSSLNTGDLVEFAGYWLERTDCRQPAADPNDPSRSL
jgi:hypothetical protein